MLKLKSSSTPPLPGKRHEIVGPSRLEFERTAAVALTGRIMALAALSALPFAAWFAFLGEWVPLLQAIALLAGAAGALLALGRSQQNGAVNLLVAGLALAGLVTNVTLAEINGFGLALAMLGPALAILGSVGGAVAGARAMVMRVAWGALAFVALAGALAPFAPQVLAAGNADIVQFAAGLHFVAIGTAVAVAGVRLSSVFEVFDRGQLNAYRHLVDQMQDTVVRYNEAGQLIYVSRAAEGLLGCERYELTEATLIERVHVQDRPLYLATIDVAARVGESRTIDVRMRRDVPGARLPEFVWVEIVSTAVSASPAPNAGDRHEVVLLVRDISARREREAELRKAWKAAEDASRAKSRFLATMGHELKTPLNAVLGFSDMLASGVAGDLNAQQLDYAKMIQQSGKHMSGLITTLLDMSRLEAGKFELVTDAFAPDSIVEPVFRMTDQMARERGVKLAMDCPRPLPLLVADERACRQILINLVSNAVKFSKDNGIVTVGVKRQGRHIGFTVTDRGIGMDSETVKHLGEPFFQAQDGLARHYEGSGLGLSIVKGLIDLHEGTMSVRSTPGEGTSVTVLLPINGPETKLSESEKVTPIRPEVVTPIAPWQDARKSAR